MKPILALLVVAAVLMAQTHTYHQINLSGYVWGGEDNLPVQGALVTVSLSGAPYSMATDIDGHFAIVKDTTVQVIKGEKQIIASGKLSVKNRRLSLFVEHKCFGRADIFDTRGAKLATLFSGQIEAGNHVYHIAPANTSVSIIRVQLGSSIQVIKLLDIGQKSYSLSPKASLETSHSVSLSKSLALTDSIFVVRHGYRDMRNILLDRFDSTALFIIYASSGGQQYVMDFKAVYQPATDTITLSWSGLYSSSVGCSFYEIYRSTKTENLRGYPEKVYRKLSLNPSDSCDLRNFADVPGSERGGYTYAIRPRIIRFNGGSFDTLLCMTKTAECSVFGDISFSINRGALFTSSDQCSLYVADPYSRIASIRFTQIKSHYLQNITTGETLMVNLDDPYNPPSDSVILFLQQIGWLASSGSLGSVIKIASVDYNANDSLNSARFFAAPVPASLPWRLNKGNGSKTVWAKVAYKSGAIVEMSDVIDISPHQVSVVIDPVYAMADSAMTFQPTIPNNTFTFYKRYVPFMVDIRGDTTVNQQFYAWLVFCDSIGYIMYQDITWSTNRLSRPWLETVPSPFSLTGSGPLHDKNHQYMYSIDSSSADGRTNLLTIKRTVRSPINNNTFILKGNETLNETCVPGSYWGQNPLFWENGALHSAQSILACGSPSMTIQRIAETSFSQKAYYYRKEFMLLARFIGRHFNDVQVAVASGILSANNPVSGKYPQTYFDFYQPHMSIWNRDNPNYVTNGDTIRSVFSYALNPVYSIIDKAQTKVVGASLIIAKCQPNYKWFTEFGSTPDLRNVTADTISLDYVESLPHMDLPYAVNVQDYAVNNILWSNIDPSTWDTGDYLMGVISEDAGGNKGFAMLLDPYQSEPKKYTNPWKVTFIR